MFPIKILNLFEKIKKGIEKLNTFKIDIQAAVDRCSVEKLWFNDKPCSSIRECKVDIIDKKLVIKNVNIKLKESGFIRLLYLYQPNKTPKIVKKNIEYNIIENEEIIERA